MKNRTNKKIAIVYGGKKSSWTSCRYITSNLLDAYRLSCENLTEFVHDSKFSCCGEHIDAVDQLLEGHFDEISFIDHMPRSTAVLIHLLVTANQQERTLPTINLHIYGDYSIFGDVWHQLNPIMYGKKIRFICASERQSYLVSSTLNTFDPLPDLLRRCRVKPFTTSTTPGYPIDNFCDLIPFPVRDDKFYFDNSLRDKFRTEHNIHEDEYVFCYVGRISLQKNVLSVIDTFEQAFSALKGNCRLFLTGPIDDIALPFYNFQPPTGHYQSLLLDKIYSLPVEIQDKIEYLGSLQQNDVLEVFNGSDCHLSYSLYHDEDYGMGVIEGLYTGISSIVTDWGGYAGFDINQPNLKYLPVELNDNGLVIDFSQFPEYVQHFQGLRKSFTEEREFIGKNYHEHFSIEAIANKLAHLLENAPVKNFPGFMHYIHKLSIKRRFDLKKITKGLYGSLYSNYTR